MRRGVVIGALGGILLAAVVSCLSDPREDEPTTVIDSCDMGRLSTDPASSQSSVRVYLEATETLLQKAQAVANELRDACNAIDQELGLATGTDVLAACRPIGARVEAVSKKDIAAANHAPNSPYWADATS